MKVLLCMLSFALSFNSVFAQESTIKVNPIKENEDELTKQVYKYPSFTKGKVFFNDNATAEAQLNYNKLLGQILFINPKGDTLVLAHPETFEKVVIGIDTFLFSKNRYIELLTHNPFINLGKCQTLKYIGKEKKGPYDTYSTVSAATSSNTYSIDDNKQLKILIDENSVFKLNNAFYLIDRFNNFFLANKKSFFDLFSRQENDLKEYFKAHNVNLNNEKDLLALIQFLELQK